MSRFILAISILFFAALLHSPLHAQESLDYGAFNEIPILDNGRIKPLGSFAKTRVKDFYGNTHLAQKGASQWLAETLFNPAEASQAKIFTIKDTGLKARLELNPEQDHFSIQDLQSGLEATQEDVIALLQDNNESNLTAQQKSLLEIHENVISYNELLRSFSLILPLDEDGTNFRDLLPQEQRILAQLKSITARKGEDFSSYTEDEQQTSLTGFQIQNIREGGQGNDDFKVIPSTLKSTLNSALNKELTWIAPWQIINEGKGSPATSKSLDLWAEIAAAYRNNNAEDWSITTKAARDHAIEISSISKTRLSLENIYQTIKPYHLAMILYALGIAAMIAATLKPSRALKVASSLSLFAALSAHSFGIASRIYILDRPPVGTLYESVLFVSLICAIIAAITYIKGAKNILPVTGQVAALGLLAIAPTMLQNNDSLELLVAVLNTNFWLATHVIIITAGYGVCIIAACLSHAYMLMRYKNAAGHEQDKSLQKLFQSIHKTGLIALLLTAIGTVLGGIWADQSWGRFWGWDPKENGALLIVLWLIWMQHGRLSGHIRPLGYIAFMATLNIIVALAWFGVNLLGVGLHSYGFTSGIASGLALFCTIETIFIAGLYAALRRKEAHKKKRKT